MKAWVLFQNTHMAKSHTPALPRERGWKNATIQIAFIVWIYASLASAESHVVFVSEGLALINTTTDLEKWIAWNKASLARFKVNNVRMLPRQQC